MQPAMPPLFGGIFSKFRDAIPPWRRHGRFFITLWHMTTYFRNGSLDVWLEKVLVQIGVRLLESIPIVIAGYTFIKEFVSTGTWDKGYQFNNYVQI